VYGHHKFDHVFEGSPPPTVSYLVCALPRSGSSLLCDLLASTELAGAPTEFFDREQMHAFWRTWSVTTFEDYLEALIAKKTSPNGVFGLKAFWHQLIDVFPDRGVGHVGDLFPNLHHVYVKRHDHVRQAVSFSRAIQTSQWTSVALGAAADPVYNTEHIGSLLEWIEREEREWDRFFADSAAPLLRVDYEDLAEAPQQAVVDVLRFLGVDLPEGFQAPAPTLDRQTDSISEDWVSRYRAETR
jgi:LPS sulfotransferase NodH